MKTIQEVKVDHLCEAIRDCVKERDAYRDLCVELVKQLKGVIAEAEFITQTDMAFGHGKLITKAEQLIGVKAND